MTETPADPLSPLEVLERHPAHVRTLTGMLASRAAAAPERTFLVFSDGTWSYRETEAHVARTAALFAARGVKAGDRIGVMSQNHPFTVFSLFALARLGAVLVPANPEFGVTEARYVFTHAGVSGVIASPETLETVRAACAELEPAAWILSNENVPTDVDTPVPPDVSTTEAPCLFIYTSGTTGFPKGVVHVQGNVLLAGEGFVARMRLQPSDRMLCILPLFHINALFYSLAGALAAGATLILVPKFSASTFWQTVAATRATQVNTIAAVSTILARRPESEFVPGHGLRKVYGAPIPPEAYTVFRERFGVPTLIEGYGMSEIPGALHNPFAGPHKVGSMGRPSTHPDPNLRFAEVRVVDETGQTCADGVTGELAVRTPIVMQGYYRDPEQTAAAFRDGWFMTGDLAWRDADGYFFFVTRAKDIIRKRGENISGAELDRVLEQHPDVSEAAAIPVPSELGEDEILAAVVLKPGVRADAKSIADFCRERLSAVKVPRFVAFVDALPRTPTHRVEKYKLRADAALRANAIDLAQSSGSGIPV